MPRGSEKGLETVKAEEIVVFSVVKPSKCSECGTDLDSGDFLRMESDKPLCMDCADLGDLVFLPSGNTALTRRSRKHSTLSAVVVRFNRRRNRYERQGVLVEADALEKAEIECAGDEKEREKKRAAAAVVRAVADQRYLEEFTAAIRSRYPGCPAGEAATIAHHACEKYSGRVGRTAMAKTLDTNAVDLAVRAHIRHVHTDYDALLNKGTPRALARSKVGDRIDGVQASWQRG